MAKRRKTKVQLITPSINNHAAAADIGAREIYVAVPVALTDTPVRRFETFTHQLQELVSWVRGLGITTFAMEATSVYWIPLAELLEEAGIEVCLVNPRHVRNISGRKSDVMDCQWLQYLHAVGLLRSGFRPPAQVRAIRALWRHRDALIKQSTWHVQHVQKALDQMNLQVHHVITDITGVTGAAIIEAILAGERSPSVLAKFRDPRIRASEATLVAALTGDYREEHLLCMRQAWEAHAFYSRQIRELDEQIDLRLKAVDTHPEPSQPCQPPRSKVSAKHPLSFPVQQRLHAICGVDITSIPGISALTAQTLYSEIGSDLSAFPSAKHFASWLGLCPDNRTSAGKNLSTKTRSNASRVAHALRMAAQGCHHAKHEMGDFYRRMRAKLGAAEGLVATAHKIARVLFAVLKSRRPYDPSLYLSQQAANIDRRVSKLRSTARNMGFDLIINQSTA